MLVFEKVEKTKFDRVLSIFFSTFCHFFIYFQAIIAKLALSIQVKHSYFILLLQKLLECQANYLYHIFLCLLIWNGLRCKIRLENSFLETIIKLSDLFDYFKGCLPVMVRWIRWQYFSLFSISNIKK
jgi:hypothetical protein